ncbi:MAG TPA: histidinol-phosphate transaminase [Petrotogaceae bacterium]|nr:histidinol-phosphate transaminase [Petrotogaceae bacterium]HOG33923.1 histidinol-phosphate transaminase [Petrotogaceae bacterium]
MNDIIRLDRNESPFDLPADIKEEFFNELKKINFNRYPDPFSEGIRKTIGNFINVPFENIAVGNGSDELIGNLLRVLEGEEVIITPPTFEMYYFYCSLNKVKIIESELDSNWMISPEIFKLINKKTKAVFICSPNNPTGNIQDIKTITAILDTGVNVILDEAYFEFSTQNCLYLTKKYRNLIILRTFSKAFGVAGVRTGYAIANSTVIEKIYKVRPPYSLNSLSQSMIKVLLDNRELIQTRIQYIVRQRETMIEKLKEYAIPSQTNFIFLDFDRLNRKDTFALSLYEFLYSEKFAIRTFKDKYVNKLRITLADKLINDELTEKILFFLKNRNSKITIVSHRE